MYYDRKGETDRWAAAGDLSGDPADPDLRQRFRVSAGVPAGPGEHPGHRFRLLAADCRSPEAADGGNRTIAYELSQNSELIRFGRYADGFQGETPSRLLELQNNLPNYSVSNKFIRDYFVLYPESGIVLNNRVAYDYEDFFRSYIGYSGIGTE